MAADAIIDAATQGSIFRRQCIVAAIVSELGETAKVLDDLQKLAERQLAELTYTEDACSQIEDEISSLEAARDDLLEIIPQIEE